MWIASSVDRDGIRMCINSSNTRLVEDAIRLKSELRIHDIRPPYLVVAVATMSCW